MVASVHGTVDHLEALRKAAKLEGAPPKKDGSRAKHPMLLHSTAPVQEATDLKPVFQAEAVARASFGRLLNKIKSVRVNSEKKRQATLPMRIHSLSGSVSSEESECLRLIRKTRDLVQQVKRAKTVANEKGVIDEEANKGKKLQAIIEYVQDGSTKDGVEDASVAGRLRENFVDLLEYETTEAWKQLVDLREERRQEFEETTRRRLAHAYPKALEEDLDAALETPEIAVAAVDWRLAGYARNEELSAVIAQLKNRSTELGAQQKMEAEALDLEFLFFQFNEIVGGNDEKLNAIEQNVESSLEATVEAVDYLREARSLKTGNDRMKCLMIAFGVFALLYLAWWFNPFAEKKKEDDKSSLLNVQTSLGESLGRDFIGANNMTHGIDFIGANNMTMSQESPRTRPVHPIMRHRPGRLRLHWHLEGGDQNSSARTTPLTSSIAVDKSLTNGATVAPLTRPSVRMQRRATRHD